MKKIGFTNYRLLFKDNNDTIIENIDYYESEVLNPDFM